MQTESFIFRENDWVPNNAELPVIVHHAAIDAGMDDLASIFEERFALHGWPARWRDGVFDYHHYHSAAHEALGVAKGEARLALGGPGGREITVSAGDLLILPVGTGHCRITASPDFLVVGAYPVGQDFDICRSAPSSEARQTMETLAVPEQDPGLGGEGGVATLWQANA